MTIILRLYMTNIYTKNCSLLAVPTVVRPQISDLRDWIFMPGFDTFRKTEFCIRTNVGTRKHPTISILTRFQPIWKNILNYFSKYLK
jgi:hypothetical protein